MRKSALIRWVVCTQGADMRAACLLLLVSLPAQAGPAPYRPLAQEPLVVVEALDASVELHHEIHLKFRNDLRVRATPTGLTSMEETDGLLPVLAIAERERLHFEPLLEVPGDKLAELLRRAEEGSGREQPDLAGIFRVAGLEEADGQRLRSVATALGQTRPVEWVQIVALGVPPPTDIPPTSTDFRFRQIYADPPPGIDAAFGNDQGFDGSGLRIYDCEYGWDETHEDLEDQPITREPDQTVNPQVRQLGWQDHGTAVVGILGAADNAYGITGMAAGAEFFLYPEWTLEGGFRRASAVANAIADARPGDIVVLEMQAAGAGGGYVPAEASLAVWQSTRVGTDAGVIVVAAAGNGNQNLDGSPYAPYRSRGHSGAIIVGAGTADARHDRLSFSTYGSRVDLQGWGTAITTLGYGRLARFGQDPRQSYTDSFGGTSGATPIVASAVALLQQYARDGLGRLLTAKQLRDVLVQTGTPQSNPSRPIGPLPDVRAAMAALGAKVPRIDAMNVPPGVEGSAVELSATATVSTGEQLTYQWSVGSTDLGGPTVRYTPQDDGEFDVVLTVTSGSGLRDRSNATLFIENVPPEIEFPSFSPALEGTAFSLTASLRDPGRDTATLAFISSTVDGTTVEGTTIEFTPVLADARAGKAEVLLSATDEDGGRTEARLEVPVFFVDDDGDGIADSWESTYGYDPQNPADADADDDADGRTLLVEFLADTHPGEYDGPPLLRLLSPLGGQIGRSPELVAENPITYDDTFELEFRWRSGTGPWQSSGPALPTPSSLVTAFVPPTDAFAENETVAWSARGLDAYMTGPESEVATFLYSAIEEAPPVPVIEPARLRGEGDGFTATLRASVEPDPEGQAIDVEFQVRRGERVVRSESFIDVAPGPLTYALVLKDNPEGLTWTARVQDSLGTASVFAEPAPIGPASEGCGCATAAGADTSWGILIGLGLLLGLRRGRSLRPPTPP